MTKGACAAGGEGGADQRGADATTTHLHTTTRPHSLSTHPHAPAQTNKHHAQVIKAVLKRGDDATQLSLLYANVSPDDILLREELDALAAAHPNFRVWYTGERAQLLSCVVCAVHG